MHAMRCGASSLARVPSTAAARRAGRGLSVTAARVAAAAARPVASALAPCPRAAARALSVSAPAASGGEVVDTSRLMRFRSDDDGEEYFGVPDVTETTARVAMRDPSTGKMTLSASEKRSIDIILPPVDPPAIFAVGLNYADHAKEVNLPPPTHPIIFNKTINTLIGHTGAILLPEVAKDEVDYEGELAVVIGREAKNVSEANALEHVLGYTIANDVTARKWQGKKGGGQWSRGKNFDSFLPLGPYLIPRSAVPDPQKLTIRTWVNDTLVQDSNTSQMLFSVAQIIAFLSQDTTLFPGTVILTGTPAGVGYVKGQYLQPGDNVRVSIEGLGTLRNVVAQTL